MKTLLAHQRLSCNPLDFLLAQFIPYNEKNLRSFIPKPHVQWIGSARAGISYLLSPGEKVGLPSFTCRVVAAAVAHAKAVPVFIDAGAIVKAEDVEKHIAKIDTLLIPYNFGFVPQMDKIAALCRKHSVRLIEDGAQALGATSKGKLCGSFGAAVYSFGISKNIGFMGGLLATESPSFYKGKFYPILPRYKVYTEAFLARVFFNPYVYPLTEQLLTHGFSNENVIPYAMPDFAKYGVLVQARRYASMLALRRSNAAYLMKELVGHIDFVKPEPETEPAWLYFVLLHKDRERIRVSLLKEGIDVRPLHTFGDMSGSGEKAAAVERNHLAFALLRSRVEVEQIAAAIKRVMKNETSH